MIPGSAWTMWAAYCVGIGTDRSSDFYEAFHFHDNEQGAHGTRNVGPAGRQAQQCQPGLATRVAQAAAVAKRESRVGSALDPAEAPLGASILIPYGFINSEPSRSCSISICRRTRSASGASGAICR